MGEEEEVVEDTEDGDPSVPSELLDLHVQLEDDDMTLEKFKEVFGG